MNRRKLFGKLLQNPANVRFAAFVRVVEAFGFRLDRVAGSHRIYVHSNVPVPLNLQPLGGQAKPYQVRQFLDMIESYDLLMEDDAQ